MLPSIADVDVSRLSPRAREALAIAKEVFVDETATLEEAAERRGTTPDAVMADINGVLAVELRDQAGVSALPDLNRDEYEGLLESIREHGQLVPILVNEATGEVIDGRHRERACRALGIEPRYQEARVDADQQQSLALVVNVARRQLTAGARRGLVEAELIRDASRSDRSIAAAVGVSPTTVGDVRRELEERELVSRVDTRRGRDGVVQPATKTVPDRQTTDPVCQPGDSATSLTGIRELRVRVADEFLGTWISCSAFRFVPAPAGDGSFELEVRH